MQHGKESSLVTPLDRRGPRIGFVRLGMTVDLKNVYLSIPDSLASKRLNNVLRLNPGGLATVLRFYCGT
jgi:hypothetical protein